MKLVLKSIQFLGIRLNILLLLIFSLCFLTLSFTVAASVDIKPIIAPASSSESSNAISPYLDPDFGVEGIVITSINGVDQPADMVVQPDGSILIAGITRPSFYNFVGDQLLVRYLAGGSLDTTFGTGGMVITSLSSGYDIANAVSLQADGKIVTGGHSSEHGWLTVARYHADGSPDTMFGQGSFAGVVTTTIGTSASAKNIVIQPGGEIIAVGNSRTDDITGITIVRFEVDGTLDNSFGTQGVTTTIPDPQSNRSIAFGVALQSDGKIVVGGYDDRDIDTAVLVRYNSNGTLDTTFGTSGIITETFGTAAAFWDVAVQPDDKILAAGQTNGNGMLIARYNSDGTLDTSFANDGVFTMGEVGYPGKTIAEIALFDDGKIVAAGVEGEPGIAAQQLIVVLQPDGSFSNYWGQGWAMLQGPSSYNTISAVSILDQKKIITSGTTNGSTNILLAQYRPLFPQAYIPFIISSGY